MGRAVFAWRAVGAEPVALLVPHPWSQVQTLEQARQFFHGLKARVLIASGTHRCANTTPGLCTGTHDHCGEGLAYRESDVSYTWDTLVTSSLQVFAEAYPEDWVIALQGRDADGIGLSDGTLVASSSGSRLDVLATALAEAFPEEPLDTCNEGLGLSLVAADCGEDTVLSRSLNGAEDLCTDSLQSSTGLYTQLNQGLSVREDFDTMLGALSAAVAAWTDAAAGDDDDSAGARSAE